MILHETVESSNSIENELNFRVQIAARSTSKVTSVITSLGKEWHASSVSVFQGMGEMSRVITSHACKFRVYVPYVSNRM